MLVSAEEGSRVEEGQEKPGLGGLLTFIMEQLLLGLTSVTQVMSLDPACIRKRPAECVLPSSTMICMNNTTSCCLALM